MYAMPGTGDGPEDEKKSNEQHINLKVRGRDASFDVVTCKSRFGCLHWRIQIVSVGAEAGRVEARKKRKQYLPWRCK